MKKLFKWQKILLIAIAVIAVIRMGYIFNENKTSNYVASKHIDVLTASAVPCENVSQTFRMDGRPLYAIEFILNGIAEDKTGKINLMIHSENELVYQTDLSLQNIQNLEVKRVYINFVTREEREYRITLNAKECTQIPDILVVSDENASPEIINSYADGKEIDGQFAIGYGYLEKTTAKETYKDVVIWSIVFLTLAAVVCAFFKIKKIVEYAWKSLPDWKYHFLLMAPIELLCGVVIINKSGMHFQWVIQRLFLFLSVVSAWNMKGRTEFLTTLLDQWWKKLGLCLLYLYSAFGLVGQRIFIYPLNAPVAKKGILLFVITVIWFVPVVNSLIYAFLKLSKRIGKEEQKRLKTPVIAMVCIIFLLLPAVLHLYANNPGITSQDTYDSMLVNAHNLQGMVNWHPAFYCMILKLILNVWDSTYAVILVQYLFWSYVLLEGLLYLRKKGMSDGTILLVAFLLGISVGNVTHINTIWKDIPYTISVLWVVILLAKLTFDFEEYKGKWYLYGEFILALLGTYFYRKNGMVTFAIVAVTAFIVLYKNKKIWGTLLITVVLILFIQGPVYSYFEVEDTGRRGMYIGLGQDILGVYYARGDVSEDTMKMITVMTDYNNAEYGYIPTWSYQSYDLDVSPVAFVMNYLDTFIRNPVTMIRAVVAREDAMWNIFQGEDATVRCVNYTDTMDGEGEWNLYYPKRIKNVLYTPMAKMSQYTVEMQWLSIWEWRVGIFTLLGIIAVWTLITKKGFCKNLIITAPILGHILGLLLSTGWSDYRYFWPLKLMNIFVISLILVTLKEENEG